MNGFKIEAEARQKLPEPYSFGCLPLEWQKLGG